LIPQNVTFFHSELLLDKSVSFTSSWMKDLCQKWKVKLIIQGDYRLSETGIVVCLETIDLGCNLKQFDWPWPDRYTPLPTFAYTGRIVEWCCPSKIPKCPLIDRCAWITESTLKL